MKLGKIKKLNEQIITLEQFEKIEESENVINIENNGLSGQHYNKHWYSVYLKDDTEIQIYIETANL